MSFEIAVDKLPVRLVTRDGEERPAAFYLHRASAHALRHESVGDRLNEPHADFLPCEVEGGFALVRLGWIAYVRVGERPPELAALEEVGAPGAEVELELVTGARLHGELFFEGGRGAHSRVSDYLNSTQQRFLLLRSEGGALYVHRDAVTRVRC